MSSPIVEVRENAGAWVGTTNGVNVAAGSLVSIRLQNNVASTWQLECFGTDELTSTPTLTGVTGMNHEVSTPSTVVTFTMPSGTDGRALIFRSIVDGGGGGLTTTFGIFKLTTLGDRVGAAGEEREGSEDFGWITKTNPLIRNSGGGGGGGGLPAISNQQYSVLMEDPAGVLIFQRLTQDMILPAFSISSLVKIAPNGATVLYRRGDAIAINGSDCISITMSYSSLPDVANMADAFVPTTSGSDTVSGAWPGLVSPFTSGTRSGSVRRDGSDLAVDPYWDVILTATKATSSKQANIRITWTRDVFWGVGSAGQSTEAFIEALTGTQLSGTRARSFLVHPSNQKVYYAYPKAYGLATFTLNGFPAAFNAPSEVQVTNGNSVQSTYYLYESTNLLQEPTVAGLTFIAS